jgi:DNA repair protein RadA/Sms
MKLNTKNGFDFGTNVLDIKVPDALRTKIKTSVDYIDGSFGGQGLTPSSVTLFTGTPGAGKTTMMLNLADKLVGNGASVVFNTCEESLYQIKMTAERLRLRHGFAVGEEEMVPALLENCDKIRTAPANKNKPFILIVDSLQTLNCGKYGPGNTNSRTPERALAMITNWCKENNAIALVIGQVGKNGQFSGRNVLKHMVDSMLELTVEEDSRSELYGCRVLTMTKNRFGGAGHRFYLDLKKTGFRVVAKLSA